jgi:hypothetical protein
MKFDKVVAYAKKILKSGISASEAVVRVEKKFGSWCNAKIIVATIRRK